MGKGISIRNIRTALYNLEKYRFLANISTKTGRLITVVNYSKYQVMIKQGDKDTDKQVTKTRQRGDKEVTIEKNYKNNKNINKKKILVRKDPTFRQECDDILTLWNDQEIEKDIPSVDTDLKRQMNIALMNYKVGKIIEAINNYSTSLKDDTYYYSHHWSLLKFLKVNKAMPEWFDDGINWINYTNRKELEKKKEPFAKPTTPYKKEEL